MFLDGLEEEKTADNGKTLLHYTCSKYIQNSNDKYKNSKFGN